jgi:antitoxin VapB
MSLTITNKTTVRLAKKLAAMTGESIDEAVADSLRQRIDDVKRRASIEKKARELVEIGKRCTKHWKFPMLSTDHGSLLYDEDGLPK